MAGFEVQFQPDGTCDVVDAKGNIVAAKLTNADAWRWIDRHRAYKPWNAERKERV